MMSRIEELREYQKMADEIHEMYQDADKKCSAAIDAGCFEVADELIEFMQECSRQLENLTLAMNAC
ncbi:hypothetical protein [Bacteroides acidifaciens]|uniref:hypothetical protein n=1 Tax=Bacteroides acidifaciens TaxID=85831 RepID=UPI00263A60F8|nr:hypothetical protein [Bacteroides acidifaciens]